MNRSERLDDTEESLRLAQENSQAQLWTALPGIVKAVDLTKQTCSVQPAIRGSITDKEGEAQQVQLPMLVDVPICFPRAGTFALTFPVEAGDECLVVFASRCIDAWWQSGGVQNPAEWRMHDLSDGFCILAPTSQPRALGGVSDDAVQLRNESGDAFVQIDKSGNITLKTPADVYVDAGGKIDLKAPTINLRGAVHVSGSIDCNGVNISDTHTHGGVSPGSSRTSTPG